MKRELEFQPFDGGLLGHGQRRGVLLGVLVRRAGPEVSDFDDATERLDVEHAVERKRQRAAPDVRKLRFAGIETGVHVDGTAAGVRIGERVGAEPGHADECPRGQTVGAHRRFEAAVVGAEQAHPFGVGRHPVRRHGGGV